MHALVYNCGLSFLQQLHWFGFFTKAPKMLKLLNENLMNLNTRDICSIFNLIFDLTHIHYYDAYA